MAVRTCSGPGRRVGQQGGDLGRQVGSVAGAEQGRSPTVLGHLAEHVDVGHDGRHTEPHRLGHHDAEPLDLRRRDEHLALGDHTKHVGMAGDVADQLDAVGDPQLRGERSQRVELGSLADDRGVVLPSGDEGNATTSMTRSARLYGTSRHATAETTEPRHGTVGGGLNLVGLVPARQHHDLVTGDPLGHELVGHGFGDRDVAIRGKGQDGSFEELEDPAGRPEGPRPPRPDEHVVIPEHDPGPCRTRPASHATGWVT